MTLFVGNYNYFHIRNYADIVSKELLVYFGVHGPFAIGIIIIAVIALVLFLRDKKTTIFHLHYLFIIILEGALYAIILGYLSSRVTSILFLSITEIQKTDVGVMLSLGAGFYEELIFRALLFGISAITLIKLKMNAWPAYITAALVSSILFAWSHYFGYELFTFTSAFYRFFMGLLLCIVYRLRGFGVAAYTHAIYDLVVIFAGMN